MSLLDLSGGHNSFLNPQTGFDNGGFISSVPQYVAVSSTYF